MGAPSFEDSLVIRLLDHQIVGSDGHFIGKVDDLVLREEGDALVAEALMVGPAALAPRYPGVLGRWGWAIWRRLNDPDDPGVVLVPLRDVQDIGSDIVVSDAAREALLASFGMENWLRRHLIGRIPGAKGTHPSADEVEVPAWAGEDRPAPPERGRAGGTHRLTELLTMVVHDRARTPVGRITDVHGCADGSDSIRLTRVLIGPRMLGSSLGYSSADQEGPLAVRSVIRAVHRSAHWRDWSDLDEISWADQAAVLREGA